MPSISRRQFLGGAVVLGGAAALGGWKVLDDDGADGATRAPSAANVGRSPARRHARARHAVRRQRRAEHGRADRRSAYAAQRGALALDPAEVHALSDGFALHPALKGCKSLWDADQLAIVHGVGFAHLDRSHFHCMDVWQAGSEIDLGTGWVGRWLDADGDRSARRRQRRAVRCRC